MHNVRKKVTTAEQEARRKEKEQILIKNYNYAVDKMRKFRREGRHSDEALKLVTHILKSNPESYTVWNYRREILEDIFEGGEKGQTLDNELEFIMSRLTYYPKVYWIWNHRRWCLENHPNPNWQMELGLVSKLLERDQRNFHGWHYRRYVVDKLGKKERVEQEMQYTVTKIGSNFSNFSAWHNRAELIPLYLQETGTNGREFWKNELDYVRQGLFTDPDDQCCWIYHHWLILQHEEIVNDLSNSEIVDTVKHEISSINELYQEEPDKKWCMLTLFEYYRYLNKLCQQTANTQQMSNLLSKLQDTDPMRANRYKYLQTQV